MNKPTNCRQKSASEFLFSLNLHVLIYARHDNDNSTVYPTNTTTNGCLFIDYFTMFTIVLLFSQETGAIYYAPIK